MIKSTNDVEQDLFDVASEFFKDVIGGNVYKEGCRPDDSKEEDAVVSVSYGSATQIQDFGAYVNIYVTDLHIDGRYVPHKQRLTQIADMAESFLMSFDEMLSYEYDASLSRAAATFAESKIRQHRVSINLTLKCKTF